MYIYEANHLLHQHAAQSFFVAQFGSHALAACMLKILQHRYNIHMSQHCIVNSAGSSDTCGTMEAQATDAFALLMQHMQIEHTSLCLPIDDRMAEADNKVQWLTQVACKSLPRNCIQAWQKIMLFFDEQDTNS